MPTSARRETSGMIDKPPHPLVYVDANPIAYLFEGPQELAAALKELFAIFRRTPGIAVTSELTLAEVLPKRKTPDREFFNLMIWSNIFDLRPITRQILIDTAKYRRAAVIKQPDGSDRMPKLPDAIHVVTAVQAGCTMFLSSDARIKLPDTIKLIPARKPSLETFMREFS